MRTREGRFSLALAVVLGFLAAVPASGQSLTAATLVGSVRDAAGEPLFDAIVTAVEQGSGVTRHAVVSRSGQFRMSLLPPGVYDVLVESIGYRPKRLRAVPVFPGKDVRVALTLTIAAPPVDRIDTASVRRSAALEARGPGMGERVSARENDNYPSLRRDATDFLRMGAKGLNRFKLPPLARREDAGRSGQTSQLP